MRKYIIPAFIIALFILVIPLAAGASSGTCGAGLTWEMDDAGALVISGTGPMNNYKSSGGPWKTTPTSVVIESGVTSIGEYAFYSCKNLTSVSIPQSVTDIGQYAFFICSNLTDIHVSSIGSFMSIRYAHYLSHPNYSNKNCRLYIDGVEITDVIIPDTVTSIGGYSFRNFSAFKSITIPNSVTGIETYAFSGCTGLTGITIPASVTSLGTYVFNDCTGLTDITIPDTVTSLGTNLFQNCYGLRTCKLPDGLVCIVDSLFDCCRGLTEITIPDGVTSIGNRAFAACQALTAVTIPNSVTTIGNNSFHGCTSLKNLTMSDSIVSIGKEAFRTCNVLMNFTLPDTLTSIGEGAFYDCRQLTGFAIPDSVTTIEANTFNGCWRLSSVALPSGLTSIGAGAFSSCGVNGSSSSIRRGYVFPDGIEVVDGAMEKCRAVLTINGDELPSLVFVPSGGCFTVNRTYGIWDNVTELEVPAIFEGVAVTAIAQAVFSQKTALTSVTIPDTVTSIGNSAFAGCRSLESFTIPNSISFIDQYTFSNCTALTSITIPENCTSFGSGAFNGCLNLSRIDIPGIDFWLSVRWSGALSHPNYYTDCHLYINGTEVKDLTIPDGYTAIGDYAFHNCIGLESVTIPDSVTVIGKCAFHGCSGLTGITIPDGVTSLGDYAFGNCSGLISINIPDGVTSIVIYAFSNDYALESITIPGGVAAVPKGAFSACRSLTDVTIQNGVAGIGDNAFEQCSSLTGLTMPGSVTGIGYQAFINSGLIDITLSEGVTSIGESAFCKCYGLTGIDLPDGVTSIGNGAFTDCTSLASVRIPGSVAAIGSSAFRNCRRLTGVVIPQGLTSVEEDTFYGCYGLKAVTIPDSVTYIGPRAFSNCGTPKMVFYYRAASGLTIDSTALENTTPVVYCYESSAVKAWALNRYSITIMDGVDPGMIRTLTPEADFNLPCGTSRRVCVTVFPDPYGAEIAWSSSAPSVVSVADDGTVTALSPGTAVITAAVGRKSGSVTVNAFKKAEDFCVDIGEAWVASGDKIRLSVTGTSPADAQVFPEWTTSDLYVAQAEKGGLVTGRNPGDVTISAVDVFTGIRRSALVHVCYPVSAIDLTVDSASIGTGYEAQLTALVTTEGADESVCHYVNRLVTFTSSDEEIAAVDGNGLVTGISPGIAEITAASYSGVSVSLEIEVWNVCYVDEQGLPHPHVLSSATYEWNERLTRVTAAAVCEHDPEHTETETVAVSSEITKSPTCTEMGERTYTSMDFRNPAFTAQVVTLANIEALGHIWGDASYNWNGDATAATAARTCERDPEHTDIQESTSVIRTAVTSPSEDEKGSALCTALFDDDQLITEKTIVIPALQDMHVLRLPDSTAEIGEQAFAGLFTGDADGAVIVPDGCTLVAAGAFADCPNLLYIRLPAGAEVADGAFAGSPRVIPDRK